MSPNGGCVIGPSLPEHIDHVLAQSFLLLYSKAAFSTRVTITVGRDREFYCKEWTWSHGWMADTNVSAGNFVCFSNNNIINLSKQLPESACDSLSLFCECLVLSSLLGGDETIVKILMA